MPEGKIENKTNGEHPLQTSKCTIRFGGLIAVNELDMNVRHGEIYGLIGPNACMRRLQVNFTSRAKESTA